MATINELRVCKSCGNVFSKRAGATIIIECPQCKEINFESITIEEPDEEIVGDIVGEIDR
jgi:phage FluMu protein Com